MFSKITLVLLPLVFSLEAQTRDKNHNDAFVQGAPDETSIAREVRHQLVTLPYYGVFDDLAFRIDGSTVTLLGAVTQPVTKTDAERSVKHVDGVTQVVNNIEVLPLSMNKSEGLNFGLSTGIRRFPTVTATARFPPSTSL
jgi:hypothetical protein